MKIIFAQGNPGAQYADTRHNIGFFLIDELAKKYGVEFVKKQKFHADIAEMTVSGEKVLFVKPATFYNETGQAARLLIDFYKCDPTRNLLVVHDDLALPFGTIRTREKGSDAGNNGVKSLNAHLGPSYARLRVGIYNELRDRIPDVDFVLGRFSQDEKTALPKIGQTVEKVVDEFIHGTFEPTKITTQQ
jgi:PTH1 family peptidyl-tRNA hydrolase